MIYTCFIAVGIYLAVIPHKALTNAEVDDESDDAKLEQALMMVEILKSEYVKLLRDSMALRKGELNSASADVEQSTCAANESSTVDATSTSFSSTLSEIKQASKDVLLPTPRAAGAELQGAPSTAPAPTPAPLEAPLSSQPPFIYEHQNQFPLRRNYFRRRIPDYYYYDMFRRQFYNEPIAEPAPPVVGQLPRRNFMQNFRRPIPIQPGPDSRRNYYGESASNVTPSAAATSSAITTASSPPDGKLAVFAQGKTARPLPSRVSVVARKRRPAARTSRHDVEAIRRRTARRDASRTSPSTKEKITDDKGSIGQPKAASNDPVVAEVASALMTELAQGDDGDKPVEPWPAFPFKTTMKIFLEKSTRLPVPLPENNAFCFTNPNNRLCKTLIK